MTKICVLGAGVIGVSTAYALARIGHKVTVIDRNETVAQGASRANGAQLSYSYVDPFGSPAMLRALPKYLFGLDPAIQLRLRLNSHYLGWGISFIKNCRPAKVSENLQARAQLALDSASAFKSFFEKSDPSPATGKARGKLVLLSSKSDYEKAVKTSENYLALGVERMVLTRNECLDLEPALKNLTEAFAGGIFAPSDFALDPLIYCRLLEKECRKLGVEFLFGTDIQSITHLNGTVRSVVTDNQAIDCDAAIICLGNGARDLAKACGIHLPIYPIQGYSMTLPCAENAPHLSVTSMSRKLVYANLGQTMRVAGFMDANQSTSKIPVRQSELLETARAHWPGIADFNSAPNFWTHYRPMTPSSVPIIGESKIKNLFLNVGHGALGYTFAAGSAMRIAGMIGHALKNYNSVSGGLKHAIT